MQGTLQINTFNLTVIIFTLSLLTLQKDAKKTLEHGTSAQTHLNLAQHIQLDLNLFCNHIIWVLVQFWEAQF